MVVSSTKLRENIYSLLDNVIQTGKPLEIERKGQRLLVTPKPPANRLAKLKKRPTIKGNPQDLVHMDWSDQWKP